MDWPADGAMLLLLAVAVGERIEVADGGMVLTVRGAAHGAAPVSAAALDALEARGWVRIGDAGAEATEPGRYWLDRWMRRRVGRGRIVVTEVTARRTSA